MTVENQKIYNRLALGAAQFGMNYGIANQTGQIPFDEASSIVDFAWSNGFDTIDTAVVYGESEKVLGKIGVQQWKIISKLPAIPENAQDIEALVQQSVDQSLSRLNVSKLYGLLLHSPNQLLCSPYQKLFPALLRLKETGKVEKIGISIYSPNELDALWPHFQFDLVQAPFNIIDRRLATSGWLSKLHHDKVEVHTRSVFLQGLLLMEGSNRPAKFNRWNMLWKAWSEWLDTQSMSALQSCLGHVLAQSEISRVLVGIDSLKQLKEIVNSLKEPFKQLPELLKSDDLDLIEPFRWSSY